jgi:hypothetical protein
MHWGWANSSSSNCICQCDNTPNNPHGPSGPEAFLHISVPAGFKVVQHYGTGQTLDAHGVVKHTACIPTLPVSACAPLTAQTLDKSACWDMLCIGREILGWRKSPVQEHVRMLVRPPIPASPWPPGVMVSLPCMQPHTKPNTPGSQPLGARLRVVHEVKACQNTQHHPWHPDTTLHLLLQLVRRHATACPCTSNLQQHVRCTACCDWYAAVHCEALSCWPTKAAMSATTFAGRLGARQQHASLN